MQFIAQIHGVRADLTKKQITLTFTVDATDEDMAAADELANRKGQDVALTVTPRQIPMFATANREKELTHG